MAKTIVVDRGVGTFIEQDDSFGVSLPVELKEVQGDLLDVADPAVAAPPVVSFVENIDFPREFTAEEAVPVAPAVKPSRAKKSRSTRGRPRSSKGTAGVAVAVNEAQGHAKPVRNMFTVFSLLFPPVLISIISAMHMYEFFLMANPPFMAFMLAASYELLNLATLVAIWQFSVMSRGTRTFIWTALIMLVALLIVGNCYSNYLHLDPGSVGTFAAQWGLPTTALTSRILALIHGSLLPLTTVAFVKAVSNYWQRTESKP